MYQIYFYVNLLKPLETSKILNDKKLNKKIIEKLLNEVLSTDREENENRIERFAKKKQYK